MKVSITKQSKKVIKLEEAPIARKMIEEMKDDEISVSEYAEMAARVAGGNGNYEILKASAEIAKNARVLNRYGDDTGDMDIWIEFYAFNSYRGFFEIGVYLSDIWGNMQAITTMISRAVCTLSTITFKKQIRGKRK